MSTGFFRIAAFFGLVAVLAFAWITAISRTRNEPNPHGAAGPFYVKDFRAAGAPRAAPPELKFVSYNIEYGKRVPEIVQDLRREGFRDADFILLQEATGEPGGAACDAFALARALGLVAVFAPASVRYRKDYGNAILSRWDLGDFQKVLLPHSERGNQRIALLAQARVGERQVGLVSVHLSVSFLDSWAGERSRAEQVLAFLGALAPHGPTVISGDFNNFNPWGWARARDAILTAGFDENPFEGSTFKSLGLRLDHVFLRGLRATDSRVGRDATGSDHFPVRWTAEWLEPGV